MGLGDLVKRATERVGVPVPRIGGIFGVAAGIADALKDKPEYLVQYAKGREPAKIYAGQEQKDGSVKFQEITRDQLTQLQQANKMPEAGVQTLAQMRTQLAQMNTPASLTSAVDVATRIDARLQPEGRPHDTALDTITSGYTGRGKTPAVVAAGVDTARTTVLAELNDEIDDMKEMKDRQHPALKVQAEGGTMSLRDTMNVAARGEIEKLEPAEKLSNAVSSFEAQIVNAPAVAPAAAPTPPRLGNF